MIRGRDHEETRLVVPARPVLWLGRDRADADARVDAGAAAALDRLDAVRPREGALPIFPGRAGGRGTGSPGVRLAVAAFSGPRRPLRPVQPGVARVRRSDD